jgi:hypothetical protein
MNSVFEKKAELLNAAGMLKGIFRFNENDQKRIINNLIEYFSSIRDCELFLKEKLTAYDISGGAEAALKNLGEFYKFIGRETPEDYINKVLNKRISQLKTITESDESEKRELSDFLWNYKKSLPAANLYSTF